MCSYEDIGKKAVGLAWVFCDVWPINQTDKLN